MPTLVAVDVSVAGDRIRLVFSHRAVAQAYAKYLQAEDGRSRASEVSAACGWPTAIPGYRRDARYDPATKEITLALPPFITWFITCRMPDDEDCVTFTFDDADAEVARRWAESMVLFERVAAAPFYHDGDDDDDNDDGSFAQLHVRRLWNKVQLLQRLEDGIHGGSGSGSSAGAGAGVGSCRRSDANYHFASKCGGPSPRSIPLPAATRQMRANSGPVWWYPRAESGCTQNCWR